LTKSNRNGLFVNLADSPKTIKKGVFPMFKQKASFTDENGDFVRNCPLLSVIRRIKASILILAAISAMGLILKAIKQKSENV